MDLFYTAMFGIQGDKLVAMVEFNFEDRDLWQVVIETTDNGMPAMTYQVGIETHVSCEVLTLT